jgi:hypothetical protein
LAKKRPIAVATAVADDEFHQIQEDRTEGFDVIFCKLSVILHQKPGDDSQDQRDEDLHGERQGFLFCLFI